MIKVIPNHPNYAASENGIIYSLQTGVLTELKRDMSTGYPRVTLDGQKKYVANLVADCFMTKPEPKQKIFYIDGDTSNCSLANLVWLSPSEIQFNSHYTIEYRQQTLKGRA